MIEILSQEALMVLIMNQLASKLPGHAILKGDILFRLLDSPRATKDLDYVFVPYKSKKDILPLIREALEEFPGLNIKAEFNSKALRMVVTYQDFKVQVEANVAANCASEEMSTAALAKQNNQLPQIIRVMRYDIALAHKLATWNERDLVRDLYDAYFLFTNLGLLPDQTTLLNRLKNVQPAKRLKNKPVGKEASLAEFIEKLKIRLQDLNQSEVDEELSATLGRIDRAGLHLRIRSGLIQMIEKLQSR